ncbi:hypothetical protein E2C01_099043 [Portunus trituberculatus]|uniref:Uncharacterized protein n=1 Tax=Portunus trituberculatus TaxID=210409 RepID=A0A5B7KFM6_PORTR|nr:hypothetical protein [Portunus trituberculatus]
MTAQPFRQSLAWREVCQIYTHLSRSLLPCSASSRVLWLILELNSDPAAELSESPAVVVTRLGVSSTSMSPVSG